MPDISHSKASVKVVLLVEESNNEHMKVMVCELPGLQPVYTLELSHHVVLLHSYPREVITAIFELTRQSNISYVYRSFQGGYSW